MDMELVKMLELTNDFAICIIDRGRKPVKDKK